MLIGLPLTIEKLLVFMLAMEFYSIMNRHVEAKHLLLEITMALTRIDVGLQERLYVGNLDAKRDWGHARTM